MESFVASFWGCSSTVR